MRLSSSFVLVAAAALSAGCPVVHSDTDYGSHTELPMEAEMTLTPQGNVSTMWVSVEPRWSKTEHTVGPGWNVNDRFTATARVRWITLEREPAPTIVDIRGRGPDLIFETQQILQPNTDFSFGLDGQLDFEACGDPCRVELEVAWHHGQSGEVRIDWSANASRNSWREEPYASMDLAFKVTPVDFTIASTQPEPSTLAVAGDDPES